MVLARRVERIVKQAPFYGGNANNMPTKRMFDLVVITVLLSHPVLGLAKMWAARVTTDSNAGPVSRLAAGATRIVA